jgi:hypothetical protein
MGLSRTYNVVQIDEVGLFDEYFRGHAARVAGTTQLNGRTVQRIDIYLPQQLPADAPLLPPGHPAIHAEAFAYVQPETFHPVEIVYGGQTDRFLAYEYLPASTANLALTDAHRHPRATPASENPQHDPGAKRDTARKTAPVEPSR